MDEVQLITLIAEEMGLQWKQVKNTIDLLDGENTVPFIARYRKEMTGSLNEEQIRAIEDRIRYLRSLEERKQTVLKSIDEQGKLTPELEEKIRNATRLQDVEDLYLPYKPKKRTRATIAREKGLQPLADMILAQEIISGDPLEFAAQFINPEQGVGSAEEALAGAQDIVAETISDDAEARKIVRAVTVAKGSLVSKAKEAENFGEYEIYADFSEAVKTIPPHRILAINRGERENFLRVSVDASTQEIIEDIEKLQVKNEDCIFIDVLRAAIKDSYNRLIAPAIEREVRNLLTERADAHAIEVFVKNLRALLMQPPISNKIIMGIDPGYRTGCKVAVIDQTGKYLEGTTIYPHEPEHRWESSKLAVTDLIRRHNIQIVAIGNGTASRETEQLVAEVINDLDRKVVYAIVSEAGASVYSASPVAKEEFPGLEASMRGNISIARRLMDPLSELVKIDPRSIGVGLYQHDVNQTNLNRALDRVVESCVNNVGVNLNTASVSLLKYIAGINSRVAQNIVKYREEHGKFTCREQLKEVKGLGENAFVQAAGFLRILDGDIFFDSTAVHPESYQATEVFLNFVGVTVKDIKENHKLLRLKLHQQKTPVEKMAEQIGVGLETLSDIIESLEKPNRDPREEMPRPIFRSDILKMEDLAPGMILRGTVRNVVDFGAFVDIGVKQDGLVHLSKMSKKYVRNPLDIVSVGDVIEVKIVSVDLNRGRISLSMVLDE